MGPCQHVCQDAMKANSYDVSTYYVHSTSSNGTTSCPRTPTIRDTYMFARAQEGPGAVNIGEDNGGLPPWNALTESASNHPRERISFEHSADPKEHLDPTCHLRNRPCLCFDSNAERSIERNDSMWNSFYYPKSSIQQAFWSAIRFN